MVNKYLRPTILDAQKSHTLILLDKGVTCVPSSSLDQLVNATLPSDISQQEIQSVHNRFRQWITTLKGSVQTVRKVADEVHKEHRLLKYRSQEFTKQLQQGYQQNELSKQDLYNEFHQLQPLISLQEIFAQRFQFTLENTYRPKQADMFASLYKEVTRISLENQSKSSKNKVHDTTSRTDEQLAATAIYHAKKFGSAAILTTDKDISHILDDYAQTHPIHGVVSVYRFVIKNPQNIVHTSYKDTTSSTKHQTGFTYLRGLYTSIQQ